MDDMEITPAEVARMQREDEDFVLLDCRGEEERRIARIEPSILLPMHELAVRIDEIADQRERPIVVYCHSGQRSLMVTAALRHNGFADVRSMAGGIDRWSVEIDGSIPRY